MKNDMLAKAAFVNRVALFLVFIWFGFLKIVGISPAEELVGSLFDKTLAFALDKNQFLIAFGVFEVFLGFLWLFGKQTKLAFWLFSFHMFSTFLPMVLLVDATWQSSMVLTLTGQYIMKNLILVGSAYFIYSYWHSEEQTAENVSQMTSLPKQELVLD